MTRKARKMKNAKRTVYNVYGMTCGGCSSMVQSLLLKSDKVDNAEVDHEANTATVYGDLSHQELREILSKTSYTTD